LSILAATVLLGLQATPRISPAEELKFNTQDFPPFAYQIDGVVAGPAVDVIQRICTEIEIDCTFRLLPWKRAQGEVRSGKAHGMFVIGWNEERAKWVHFTPPLMRTEYGFFVKADNPMSYTQPADIQGKMVAVYGPSNTANSLEKIRKKMQETGIEPIKIDMRPDDEAGFKKLALGRADAVFSNREAGFALLAKLNLNDSARYAGASRSLKYYIGFSKAHTDKKLIERFDAAFVALRDKGVIQEILLKHKMEPAAID
jgi:polar amino acid transport system substrate-binding protein